VEIVIILAVLAAVTLFVSGPLRRGAPVEPEGERWLAELEAARDAKYREIRDAELDHSTGKLSDEDHQAVDRALRLEAIEILHHLDDALGRSSNGSGVPLAGNGDPGAGGRSANGAGATISGK
jgi:hypothetical protein